mgnify:CR=1 FL=1
MSYFTDADLRSHRATSIYLVSFDRYRRRPGDTSLIIFALLGGVNPLFTENAFDVIELGFTIPPRAFSCYIGIVNNNISGIIFW